MNNFGVPVGESKTSLQAWIGNASNVLSDNATALDINDHGQVVGWHAGRAFRWTGGPTVENLGTLDPSCTTCESAALAINDHGFIVGYSQFFASSTVHAFLWPQLFGPPFMTDLGTLCSGFATLACLSWAEDINIHGHIVGFSETDDGLAHRRAFLYKDGTMTDLNTLLAPADQANWLLLDARAINDLGQIAGTGSFQGTKLRAFLLTPPLPFIFDVAKVSTTLFTGNLPSGDQGLRAKLDAAQAAFERGNLTAARNQLDAYINEVQALVQSRQLGEIQGTKLVAGATLLRDEIERHRAGR